MTFFKALELKILVYIVHKVGKKVLLSGIRCLCDLGEVPPRGGKVTEMTPGMFQVVSAPGPLSQCHPSASKMYSVGPQIRMWARGAAKPRGTGRRDRSDS